jgi:hypothetical protein
MPLQALMIEPIAFERVMRIELAPSTWEAVYFT